jgi:hypothetical protein
MIYNRINKTDRLNKACKNPATWGDTKMFDRAAGVSVRTPVKRPFTNVTIVKTKRMMRHKL